MFLATVWWVTVTEGAERDGTVAQPIGDEIPKRAFFRANSGRWTVVIYML
jgi:hypothetical protein